VSFLGAEDKIRELCALVIAADESEWPQRLIELNAALREHFEGARHRVMAMAERSDSLPMSGLGEVSDGETELT
jgi:hypothetical protein